MPLVSLAATSDFSVRTLVSSDFTPPTTPSLLSVVPVSHDQIDVAWSVSTDDGLLGGYVLLRDGVPLATTTLTNFNDTGLTASTTYSYSVYAFDNIFNLSTTSNALATTTLELPVPPVATTTPDITTPKTSSGSQTLVLNDLKITPTVDSAKFVWQTLGVGRYILRWGKSTSYSDGYISNDTYKTEHTTTITGLNSDTTYYFELVGYTPFGTAVTLQQGTFQTLPATLKSAPPNVSRLWAEAQDDSVLLSWQLPALNVDEIASVRIVRSHLGFPTDINDGAVVFEGLRSSFFDAHAFAEYDRQFYTLFVQTKDGQVSSGAVVVATRQPRGAGTAPGGQQDNSGGTGATTTAPDNTSTSSSNQDNETQLTLGNFSPLNIVVKQGEQEFNFASQKIALSYQQYFVISIQKSALPDHLKSIVVTLTDPEDQMRSYSFLLKLNADQTAYEATIAPLNVLGASKLQVEIFDFGSLVVGSYSRQIDFVVADKFSPETEVVFPDQLVGWALMFKQFWYWWLLLLLLLFLIIRHYTRSNS